MDSPSAQNWLAFSLSNNHLPSPSDSSQLCFFEAFHTNNHSGDEDASGATELSILTCGSPKLEDFLGGSGSSGTGGAAEVCQFSAETAAAVSDTEIYDSDELKTIAASFLRGFSGEQHSNRQKQLAVVEPPPLEPPAKKAIDTFGQRTSIYRGVTRHRWTGRYEAHLWDNSCRREGQSRKGRQGGYDKEEKAARAYDLAALKYWGPATTTNFPVINYEKELEEMNNMSRQEFVASLRRKSSGFSRGASIYRGVTRHHQHGRWQARIGRVAGNKDLYLGTFSTQEEAAEAYDIAAIKFRGLNAVTNFDMSRYDVKSIANSNLPIGGMSNKSKTASDQSLSDNKSLDGTRSDDRDLSSASSVTFTSQPQPPTLSFALPIKQDSSDYWSILGYQSQNQNQNQNYFFQASNNGTMVYQGTTQYSMGYPNTSTIVNEGNGGGYLEQQSSGTSSTIPYATPIAINGNNVNYEGPSSLGNWIGAAAGVVPSHHHSFQPAKAANNLSMFQTPIFGME
ncbi:hypothetical protein LguiB_020816 [Lonicera macranthoides]